MGIPSNGASINGGSWLDAGASSPVGVASVNFELSGNGLSAPVVISGSTPTLYGWIGAWNSDNYPNGTYTLRSVATDTAGVSTTSAGITIIVANPRTTTSIVDPTDGSTQSGTSAILDAGASAGVLNVTFELLEPATSTILIIANGTPTLYGWLAEWDTTSVPNGTYTIQSVASSVASGSATSPPITITIAN